MSDAPRMPLPRASAAATLLLELWGMNNPDHMVAGSIRRKSPFVGDIDIIAPHTDGDSKDRLFERIDATVAREGALFGSDSPIPPFTKVLKGLKPHFKAANLQVQLRFEGDGVGDRPTVIPVQVCRYTPANRGWMEIMKTGPRDFNIWLLSQWKEIHGIPPRAAPSSSPDESDTALQANHLVDHWGKVVPVATERAVFDFCRVAFIEPPDREAFIAARKRSHSRDQKETMR